jgi:hypothetical protein
VSNHPAGTPTHQKQATFSSMSCACLPRPLSTPWLVPRMPSPTCVTRDK